MDFVYLALIISFHITRASYLDEKFGVLSSPEFFSKSIQWYLQNETKLNRECRDQLWEYAMSLGKRQRWALNMYDANSKLPSGILDGNFYDMGSFDECISIESVTANVTGKYCLGDLFIRDDNVIPSKRERLSQTMTFAMCSPNLCSAEEVQHAAKAIGLNITLTESKCQTRENQPGWDSLAYATLYVFSHRCDSLFNFNFQSVLLYNCFSFSLISNGKKILARAKLSNEQISCLYGLRCIGIAWVICGHTVNESFKGPARNSFYVYYVIFMTVISFICTSFVLQWLNRTQNMPLWKANECVEIFFLLGGTLVSYTFLRKHASGYTFNIIYYYIERYLRLTPPFAVAVLFLVGLYKFLGSGPLWTEMEEDIEECRSYWWASLFYVQIYGYKNCIPYTWYLSVDFELFILSPILLLPLKRWPKSVLVVTICVLLCCMVTTAILDIQMAELDPGTDDDLYNDLMLYARAPSWLIGLLLGYLLFTFTKDGKNLVLNKGLLTFGWVSAITLGIISTFATKYIMVNNYTLLRATLSKLIMRPIFSIAISWIIFSCHMGYGGIVNTFLSNPVFELFSKLTYNIYLVHFFVVKSFFNSIRTAPYLTTFDILVSINYRDN
ncbi:hypothetical protein RI129_012381 [Pyrocoelia pectoralis]|uniref:Nose resistant-to-fluoxetine protein N-terminal domain-containing protein n=1 Tax=Pyrocoelia pectoralis TaxID=417401 RepID=A0AAN7V3P1_9COLE